CRFVQALGHVKEIQAANVRAFLRACGHGLAAAQRQVHGGQALLTVEHQGLGGRCRLQAYAGEQTRLEWYAARFKKHHGANRIGQRKASDQRANMVVIPDPATLEIGELDMPRSDAIEHIFQCGFGGTKAHSFSLCSNSGSTTRNATTSKSSLPANSPLMAWVPPG